MKNLRILHINYSLNMGGLERVVVDLAKSFEKKGHIVSICCLNGKEPLGEEAELAGIKVFSLQKKPGIVWNLPIRIAKIIREEHFNIIHTHNEAGLIYGATAALLARVPNIVHTEHGKEPSFNEKKALQFAEKLLLKKVKHVVAVSKDSKNKVVNLCGIDRDRVLVIPNGIDIENFYQPKCREETRKILGIDSDNFVIGNVARMVPLKNHRFLITIFKELLKDFPKLKLVLIGDGPLRHDLEGYSKELRISNSVIFLGERKNVAEMLATFDLFILPSLTEGISITLLEAMASGTAIVASEVGGNPEVIENGKTGILVPLGNTQTWIEEIKSVVRSEDKRKSLLDMAKRHVMERFSLEVMVENYEKVYNEINQSRSN